MGEKVRRGTWVQIHRVVLEPGARAPQVPPETQEVPLELRQKGFLLTHAEVGDEVAIRTVIGREVTGRLVAVNPPYEHDFGRPVPELLEVGPEVRGFLKGGGEC